MYQYMGLLFLRCRNCLFLLLYFMRFLLRGLLVSFWGTVQPFGIPATCLSSVLSANLLSTICYIIQVVDKDIEEGWTQYWLLGWISSHCPPVRLRATDHHTLGRVLQTIFGHPTLTLTASLWGYNGRWCQRCSPGPGRQHPLLPPNLPSLSLYCMSLTSWSRVSSPWWRGMLNVDYY